MKSLREDVEDLGLAPVDDAGGLVVDADDGVARRPVLALDHDLVRADQLVVRLVLRGALAPVADEVGLGLELVRHVVPEVRGGRQVGLELDGDADLVLHRPDLVPAGVVVVDLHREGEDVGRLAAGDGPVDVDRAEHLFVAALVGVAVAVVVDVVADLLGVGVDLGLGVVAVGVVRDVAVGDGGGLDLEVGVAEAVAVEVAVPGGVRAGVGVGVGVRVGVGVGVRVGVAVGVLGVGAVHLGGGVGAGVDEGEEREGEQVAHGNLHESGPNRAMGGVSGNDETGAFPWSR